MQAYDVVVVGAGHAGCEAALSAARLGAQVVLVTLRLTGIAQMSCNPAIGGVGKGHLVREIDALGGAMACVADATGIQFRRLNMSRGPAVRSTRAQSDAKRYRLAMQACLSSQTGISILEDEVVDVSIDHGQLKGVIGKRTGLIKAGAVIVTAGTFLNGLCHQGEERFEGGRLGDASANHLSEALKRIGLKLSRFKTGTTPRLASDSIAWEHLEVQHGDHPAPYFSFDEVPHGLPQQPCHITYTTMDTHALVTNNLHRSPLYQGMIQGIGPRYCPSLEDKVVRFSDKDRHQVFLEPEGLDTDRIYPNGLSTSLPKDVQEAFLRTIPGLEAVRILQYGYAVEYDYVPPTQLLPSLMTKILPGLFLAGQINGSSGYEEAAAQGLMAGLNAARWLGGQSPAVLGRHEAYIGVLIDDLVTKGVDEPYRIFTSRAEHRLTLRETNAEDRLAPLAIPWGLLSLERQQRVKQRQTEYRALRDLILKTDVSQVLAERLDVEAGGSLFYLLRRPEIRLQSLLELEHVPWGSSQERSSPELSKSELSKPGLSKSELSKAAVVARVEEDVKYAGYIQREQRDIERLRRWEHVPLPKHASYAKVHGLSQEAKEKLQAVQPANLGEARRIPGVTPVALDLLRIYFSGRSECFT